MREKTWWWQYKTKKKRKKEKERENEKELRSTLYLKHQLITDLIMTLSSAECPVAMSKIELTTQRQCQRDTAKKNNNNKKKKPTKQTNKKRRYWGDVGGGGGGRKDQSMHHVSTQLKTGEFGEIHENWQFSCGNPNTFSWVGQIIGTWTALHKTMAVSPFLRNRPTQNMLDQLNSLLLNLKYNRR